MFATVSIDLDGLDCYHAIHGLPTPSASGDPIHEVALPRFREMLESLGIPSTLFVITRYLDDSAVREQLSAAADAGHELASHTHTHPYDLSRMDPDAIAAELDQSAAWLEEVTGKPPAGFRTPGYNVSNTILELLDARGYHYDSSVFPCPPYYAAKGLVMAAMKVTGRRSGSSMTDPRALLAPIQPYRPSLDRFHRPGHPSRSLWEFPMCVVPGLRVPVIGTSLALFGRRFYRAVYPLLRRHQQHLNLEFHGIDLLEAGDPGITPELVAKQPDLRRPLAHKRRTFEDALRRTSADYEWHTLESVAGRL